MSYDLTFPGRRSIDVTNRLTENGDYLDVKNIRQTGNPEDQFEVSGILVSLGTDSAAVVKGILLDDPTSVTPVEYPVACSIPVGLRFARIYSTGTTATKVIVLGQ